MLRYLNLTLKDTRLVTLAIVLGLVALIVLGHRLFSRLPLVCGEVILPGSEGQCKEAELESILDIAIPIGTVVPFYGEDRDIPEGWALCDGRDNPAGSRITIDADNSKSGSQLPDLQSKFIRGSSSSLRLSGIQIGGKETIDLQHAHKWAEFSHRNKWNSYVDENSSSSVEVDIWDNGIDNEGEGIFPLLVDNGTHLFTDIRMKEIEILPSYVELRFIIKCYSVFGQRSGKELMDKEE